MLATLDMIREFDNRYVSAQTTAQPSVSQLSSGSSNTYSYQPSKHQHYSQLPPTPASANPQVASPPNSANSPTSSSLQDHRQHSSHSAIPPSSTASTPIPSSNSSSESGLGHPPEPNYYYPLRQVPGPIAVSPPLESDFRSRALPPPTPVDNQRYLPVMAPPVSSGANQGYYHFDTAGVHMQQQQQQMQQQQQLQQHQQHQQHQQQQQHGLPPLSQYQMVQNSQVSSPLLQQQPGQLPPPSMVGHGGIPPPIPSASQGPIHHSSMTSAPLTSNPLVSAPLNSGHLGSGPMQNPMVGNHHMPGILGLAPHPPLPPAVHHHHHHHTPVSQGGHAMVIHGVDPNTSRPPSHLMTTFNSKLSMKLTKKHICSLCGKPFTRPSSLQTHMYSHTGEKPFKCEYEGCGRQFSVVSNLRRHKKIHGIYS